MQGLMQSYPLTLTHVFRRAERLFPEKGIVTVGSDEIVRTTYGEWAERTRRLAGVLDELKGFLAERVPKWWIPNDLEIIDEVPKTSVGKFSKKTLREQFAQRQTTA